jgi:hypothetical protein
MNVTRKFDRYTEKHNVKGPKLATLVARLYQSPAHKQLWAEANAPVAETVKAEKHVARPRLVASQRRTLRNRFHCSPLVIS